MQKGTVLKILIFGVILVKSALGQAEDPIKVGAVSADYKKNRSILKLECELKFSPPWHINSDSLEQDYLIETKILIADTAYGQPLKREYPKPTTMTLFGEKMVVFEKDVSFKHFFYLNPEKKFPVKFKLQYQACSDKICLPPKFHDLTVKKSSDGKVSVHL